MSTSLYHADYEAVRESLRAMRIKANLTQTAIAEQLGVGQSYVVGADSKLSHRAD